MIFFFGFYLYFPLDGEETRKQSRSERKSRKAILKLGFQPIPNVYHVAIMKKNKNVSPLAWEEILSWNFHMIWSSVIFHHWFSYVTCLIWVSLFESMMKDHISLGHVKISNEKPTLSTTWPFSFQNFLPYHFFSRFSFSDNGKVIIIRKW